MIKRKAYNLSTHEEKVAVLVDKINFLFKEKNDYGIRSLIRNQPINILVEALESLEDISVINRFIVVSYKIKMGELFLSLSSENQIKVLENIKSGVLVHLLNDLNADDVYELISTTPAHIQKKIIFSSSKELKDDIKQLKSFDYAQIGSIMNTTFVTLLPDMQINEAVNFLRIKRNDFDIGEEIFVVDSDDTLIGSIKTKDLIFSDREEPLSELIDTSYFSISVSDDIDELIDLFKKYTVNSVAVVNEEGKLSGIINYQDVIPEILDSNIEDVYKFYGIRETRKSYLNSSVYEIVKSRIFCLIIMLFAATFTTFVIDKFEYLGVQLTAGISSAILVPIIPIITDMCGNTGSQTTATVIQAFASGDIKSNDFWRIVKKEMHIAVLVGAILAACNFIRLVLYFQIFPLGTEKFHIKSNTATLQTPPLGKSLFNSLTKFLPTLQTVANQLTTAKLYGISLVGSLASSLALFLVVIFSKVCGVIIPFFAIKFDWDPAAVSAPALTTILDTVSSIIFFGIGVFLLNLAIGSVLGLKVGQDHKLENATQFFQSFRLSQALV